MKKKQYITPEVNVYTLRPHNLLSASDDPVVSSQAVENEETDIGW